MGRPSASTENRQLALLFARTVTRATDTPKDLIARSGNLSIFSALSHCCPSAVRHEPTTTSAGHVAAQLPANAKGGMAELEFNKLMQKEGFARVRDRRAVATKKDADPDGAGLYLFSNRRWRDPEQPQDRLHLEAGWRQMALHPFFAQECSFMHFLSVVSAFKSSWKSRAGRHRRKPSSQKDAQTPSSQGAGTKEVENSAMKAEIGGEGKPLGPKGQGLGGKGKKAEGLRIYTSTPQHSAAHPSAPNPSAAHPQPSGHSMVEGLRVGGVKRPAPEQLSPTELGRRKAPRTWPLRGEARPLTTSPPAHDAQLPFTSDPALYTGSQLLHPFVPSAAQHSGGEFRAAEHPECFAERGCSDPWSSASQHSDSDDLWAHSPCGSDSQPLSPSAMSLSDELADLGAEGLEGFGAEGLVLSAEGFAQHLQDQHPGANTLRSSGATGQRADAQHPAFHKFGAERMSVHGAERPNVHGAERISSFAAGAERLSGCGVQQLRKEDSLNAERFGSYLVGGAERLSKMDSFNLSAPDSLNPSAPALGLPVLSGETEDDDLVLFALNQMRGPF